MSMHILYLSLPAVLLVHVAISIFLRTRNRSLKLLQGPPNPSFWLGHEQQIQSQREVGELEYKWFREYGTAFRVNTCFGESVLAIADPKALQHIFHKSSYRYMKAKDQTQGGARLFGPGVSTVHGNTHQRHRKILGPAFSAAQIKPFASTFQKLTQSLIAKWRDQVSAGVTTINVLKWFPNMTLDALGETVFEYDFGALENQGNELAEMVRHLFADSVRPTPFKTIYRNARRTLPDALVQLMEFFPTKEDIRFGRWLTASSSVAQKLYDGKMQGETSEENDLLGDPAKSFSNAEALAQMSTIILAGHETSSSTLTWMVYELSRRPELQERLVKEVKEARAKAGDELTPNDYDSMPLLNAVIKETLRCHPILNTLVRQADVDDVIPLQCPIVSASGEVISQIPVTKGQRIMVCVGSYNRLGEVWGPNPHEWDPSRFLDEKRQTNVGVFANLMTFGAGVRACLGWRFAILELQAAISSLIENFEFIAPPGVEIVRIPTGIMAPAVRGKLHEGFQMPIQVKIRD
ncbi:hypothetical protein VNI00_019176 [Paramarasmius palmivorus]|uniref:Cytochrome P450 n=1 Tax=Paramarasmius palmivorus TaxID=297713 RepID=A0AAW0AQ04_9AGAR